MTYVLDDEGGANLRLLEGLDTRFILASHVEGDRINSLGGARRHNQELLRGWAIYNIPPGASLIGLKFEEVPVVQGKLDAVSNDDGSVCRFNVDNIVIGVLEYIALDVGGKIGPEVDIVFNEKGVRVGCPQEGAPRLSVA